uniref:Uncharacterized protein n=1 Tax=Panagrolaimus sp. JU765 TaxID=591449 RepID=A0AC34QLN4_9BILA
MPSLAISPARDLFTMPRTPQRGLPRQCADHHGKRRAVHREAVGTHLESLLLQAATTRAVDEAASHQIRAEGRDQASGADGVLGPSDHLLLGAGGLSQGLLLGLQTRREEDEARAEVPCRPLQEDHRAGPDCHDSDPLPPECPGRVQTGEKVHRKGQKSLGPSWWPRFGTAAEAAAPNWQPELPAPSFQEQISATPRVNRRGRRDRRAHPANQPSESPASNHSNGRRR